MAIQKKSPQYIGRYGEVIKEARIIKECDGKLTIRGQGLDKDGNTSIVTFEASSTTGKKCGHYHISKEPEEHGGDYYEEESNYTNDILNGLERHYHFRPWIFGRHEVETFRTTWLRGKQVDGEERQNNAIESKIIRKLFSRKDVIEAIKTGNPLEVKKVMTKAVIGRHTKKNIKERE